METNGSLIQDLSEANIQVSQSHNTFSFLVFFFLFVECMHAGVCAQFGLYILNHTQRFKELDFSKSISNFTTLLFDYLLKKKVEKKIKKKKELSSIFSQTQQQDYVYCLLVFFLYIFTPFKTKTQYHKCLYHFPLIS